MTAKEAINRMLETIVNRFHPEKIILFGSYAQGNPAKDSDVDLLVVMRVEKSKRETASEIDLALADRTLPLDIIVVTPEEMERNRHTVGTVIYPALRNGKVIYDRAA